MKKWKDLRRNIWNPFILGIQSNVLTQFNLHYAQHSTFPHEFVSCYPMIYWAIKILVTRQPITNEYKAIKDVGANCFCTSLLRTQFTSRFHATSCIECARCWRNVEIYSASGHFNIYARVNSLKCSVTPYFLFVDHFLCRLTTFCEKLKKICVVEVWFFSTFLPSHDRILLLLKLQGARKSPS